MILGKDVRQWVKNQVEPVDRALLKRIDPYWKYRIDRVRAMCDVETTANPIKMVWVDPAKIKYVTGTLRKRPKNDKYPHLDHYDDFSGMSYFGSVIGGDWDQPKDRFERLGIYCGVEQRFADGCRWSETEFFRKHAERIKDIGSSYNANSRRELLENCREVDALFESIRTLGYKTRRDLGRVDPLSEVAVNIGRDGSLYFNSGRHRTSIAKVLETEVIPVLVKVRHPEWEAIRWEHITNDRESGLSTEARQHRSHPDMNDVDELSASFSDGFDTALRNSDGSTAE